jgi:hypothetical protein
MEKMAEKHVKIGANMRKVQKLKLGFLVFVVVVCR